MQRQNLLWEICEIEKRPPTGRLPRKYWMQGWISATFLDWYYCNHSAQRGENVRIKFTNYANSWPRPAGHDRVGAWPTPMQQFHIRNSRDLVVALPTWRESHFITSAVLCVARRENLDPQSVVLSMAWLYRVSPCVLGAQKTQNPESGSTQPRNQTLSKNFDSTQCSGRGYKIYSILNKLFVESHKILCAFH